MNLNTTYANKKDNERIQMIPKSEAGFAHVALIAVVAVLVVATGGYVVYEHQQSNGKPASVSANAGTSSSTSSLAVPANQSNTVSGITGTISSLATSLNTSESSLNNQANTNDQTSDANVGSAATNLGGAYNASNY
jgi:hypothetical protein